MPKLTRREWFETATAVAGSLLVPSVYGADLVRGQRTPSVPDVDHLIGGVAALAAGSPGAGPASALRPRFAASASGSPGEGPPAYHLAPPSTT